MEMNIPILGLILIVILTIYRFIIYPTFISPLAKVPNAHWSSSISPVWILWTRYTRHENLAVHAAHSKHGPVVRLAPNELSVNDIGTLRTVYAGGFEKGQWYSIFDNYGVPCMFSSWYSRPHSARKRMLSNIYSKSTIQSSPSVARQAQVILYDRLLPILTAASVPNRFPNGVDIHDIWYATTMDFITAYLFGLKNASNFLQNVTERRRWFGLYHSRRTYTFFYQELPKLRRFVKKWRINLVPTWVGDANSDLEAWVKERCDSAVGFVGRAGSNIEDTGDEPVVYKAMLNGIEKERKSKGEESILINETLKYPDLSIASEMMDHLAAGFETSGITMTYVCWQLSQNLPLQDKLRAELLTITPNILLSSSGTARSIPNCKDLDALPLLHAVLMETLRLRSAIPGGQPRVTPSPSCTLGPFSDIPAGVRVGAQAYSLHRNEAVFPNAEAWEPQRWLDDENGYTEEQRKERDRWFWAFSSGGRMCVGSNFAMHEMKLLIAAVYTNFRTRIVDDEGIEQEDGFTCGPKSNKLFLSFERVVEA